MTHGNTAEERSERLQDLEDQKSGVKQSLLERAAYQDWNSSDISGQVYMEGWKHCRVPPPEK